MEPHIEVHDRGMCNTSDRDALEWNDGVVGGRDGNGVNGIAGARSKPRARRTLQMAVNYSVGRRGERRHTSFPAAIVTILPEAAILLDTTEPVPTVHPSEPPRLMVRISMPSLTPISKPSTMTNTQAGHQIKPQEEKKCHSPSSLTPPSQPKILYEKIVESYATPLMLNGLPGFAPIIP
jgi:hypothetical protein